MSSINPESLSRPLNEGESDLAAEAAKSIEAYLQGHLDGHDAAMASMLQLTLDGDFDITLPMASLDLLRQILSELARGNAVTVAPVHRELTTQQAADILNVSRPYLVTLLEDQRIPSRRVGNRRRVRLSDLLDYQEREEAHRQAILNELTSEAEDLGLEY